MQPSVMVICIDLYSQINRDCYLSCQIWKGLVEIAEFPNTKTE